MFRFPARVLGVDGTTIRVRLLPGQQCIGCTQLDASTSNYVEGNVAESHARFDRLETPVGSGSDAAAIGYCSSSTEFCMEAPDQEPVPWSPGDVASVEVSPREALIGLVYLLMFPLVISIILLIGLELIGRLFVAAAPLALSVQVLGVAIGVLIGLSMARRALMSPRRNRARMVAIQPLGR